MNSNAMIQSHNNTQALEYAKKHSENNSEKLLFIRNNGQIIFEDLIDSIDNQGKFFVVIDDANQLSELNLIVDYANKTNDTFSIKIIITVRDYALTTVVNVLSGLVRFSKISVKPFSDKEISQIIESSLGIKNADYKDRIIEIANGNTRIAILAGLLAKEENRLDAINDASQLYDTYYSRLFNGDKISIDEKALKTMATIAFLDAIHLDHIDYVLDYLELNSVSQDDFNNSIRFLHENEIIDVCNDKAVKISDQCLSNYILKLVFYDKKLLRLSETINVMFFNSKTKTIESINVLLNVFRNPDLYKFVSNEIKELWKELKENRHPGFWSYLKAFYLLNPIDTLSIINREIKLIEKVDINLDDINKKEQINTKYDGDDYIEILCGYVYDLENIDAAIELLLVYFDLRHDLYCEFIHYILNRFIIDKNSFRNDFAIQVKLIENLINHSNDFSDEFVTTLLLDIADNYLQLSFESSVSGRHNTITFQWLSFSLTEGFEKLRNLLWESIIKISQSNKFDNEVYDIINNYGKSFDKRSFDVIAYDFLFIKQIVESKFDITIQNGILAIRLYCIAKHTAFDCEGLFDNLIHSKKMEIYRLLTGRIDDSDEFDYEKQIENRHLLLPEYLQGKDVNAFYEIIDICAESPEKYNVSEGLQLVLEYAAREDYYLDIIKYLLVKSADLNLNIKPLVGCLFDRLDDDIIFELVSNTDVKIRLQWVFNYFVCLPQQYINSKNLKRVYDFYNDFECTLSHSPSLDITNYVLFNSVDANAFTKICRAIFDKYRETFLFCIHFELMFNPVAHNANEIITLFENDLTLLKELYFCILSKKNLYASEDLLLTLYSIDPAVLDEYINFRTVHNSYSDLCKNKDVDDCFFQLDNYIEIYVKIIQTFIQNLELPHLYLPYYFESIFTSNKKIDNILNKRKELILYIIHNFYNCPDIINSLFETIAEHMMDKQSEYIKALIDVCDDYEIFEKIPIIPNSYSWSNSAIPLYASWIRNLEKLLPLFSGLKYINHKKLIKEYIDSCKKRIKKAEIDEMIRGF